MRVRKGRPHWALVAAGALACGDDGVSVQPELDAGRAADAATVGVSSADASADASVQTTTTQDAGSCAERSSAASSALQAALHGADQSCNTDADCKITYLNTDCFHACSAAVSAAAQQALDTAVAEQNRTTCAGFEAHGCSALVPPCVAPGAAACIAGMCMQFEGPPPSSVDAGASKAALVLDNAASAGTAELVVGQRLELTLHAIGPGYGDPQLSSTAVLFAQSFFPQVQNPGGPTEVFVFQAQSPGQVELTIPRMLQGDPFKLTVTIR